MLTHLISVLTYALAAVGGVFIPWSSASSTPDEPSAANPAAYAEIGAANPDAAIATSTLPSATNVPILVYHIVRPRYESDSAAVRAIAHTPEIFEAELRYLQDAGYTVIGFDQLESHLTRGATLPPHPIVLSFDDGWANQYAYAFPLLEKYGDTATFFVFTNALDRRGFLTWDQLASMVAAGMTVGNHTRSHPYLTKIASREKLWDEISASKALLEERLGVPIRQFAYPFGMHDATTTALVRAAGYASARGDYFTGPQTPDKLFTLSAQNAPTTLEEFKRSYPVQR